MNEQNAKPDYGDIIDLPYRPSADRPHMSMRDRAAQFSPFAALTGYDDEIDETARLTDVRREKGEEELTSLGNRIRYLAEHTSEHPQVTVVYFEPDQKKAGGAYRTVRGEIKRVDESERVLLFTNGKQIPLDEIDRMESPLFEQAANGLSSLFWDLAAEFAPPTDRKPRTPNKSE